MSFASPAAPSKASPLPRVPEAANQWMLLALASLSLLATWIVSRDLADRGETLRLAIFFVASAGYFLCSVGVFATWYRRIGLARYFILLVTCVAVMLVASRLSGRAWPVLLPLACQAVLYLSAPWLWIMLGAILVAQCFPLRDLPYPTILFALLNNLSSFLFTVGCSWAIKREFQTRAQLEVANEQLRLNAEKIEALAVAEERNRLAREIHDGVAHHLTAANVLLEAGRALLNADQAKSREPLLKAQDQIRAALVELRDSIESRHERSASLPLAERIQKLITDGQFSAHLEIRGEPRALSPEAAQAIFRIAQEALTNARKHAPESSARLILEYQELRCAFRAENADVQASAAGDGSFGLLNLRQRVQQLGGSFAAGPDGSGKFVVSAEIPA